LSRICIWLVVSTPLKNISQLGSLFLIYGKIKNVPNHQPAYIYIDRLTLQWNYIDPNLPTPGSARPMLIGGMVSISCILCNVPSLIQQLTWPAINLSLLGLPMISVTGGDPLQNLHRLSNCTHRLSPRKLVKLTWE
jgi:hypothetical protein